MQLTEAGTRPKLIDPALHHCGWTEDLIRREEIDRGVDIIDGNPRRKHKGRIDYLLRIRVNINSQPVAGALIEAKKNNKPPDKRLEQAKKYALLNHVPFVYSSNGYLFVEYDDFKGKTFDPCPLEEFPTPQELRERYEVGIGGSLESENAKPLIIPYVGGEASRRYYQDAAIRAALEKIAQGKNRLLLYLATGSGKTFIAVYLLKKIADAGHLRRALFVCDRDELRAQALGAFQNVFGADSAAVSTSNPKETTKTIIVLANQFGSGGTEELENPYIFNSPDVIKAGSLEALKILGDPGDIIKETKERLFAA